MESPTLSRSPSATFAPGRGRRSHTNVHHLSLAPLTPKYPIDPADYEAYFDPMTAQLHTSSSLTQFNTMPSPGGILTNSPVRSRANSRLRRKPKSTVSIQAPEDEIPSGALTSEGYGQKKLRVQADWLVQTGLALTEGSRKSKGQTWITKRDSSLSLHTADENPRSGRTTPRDRSRRRSRKTLSMTPAAITPIDDAQPDWADFQTQAEIAAQVQNDLVDEYDDDDPYGMLDFEANISSDDEEEVRRAISKYKLGQWMDNVVDVMLKLEDEPQEIEEDEELGEVEPPPIASTGLWGDVTWFGRLLVRTVTS